MELLKELISILSRDKIRHSKLYDQLNEHKKLGELYNGIKDQKITSDQEASCIIYEEKELTQKYRNLKNRLLYALLNLLFFLDTKKAKYTDYQNAYINCYRNLALIKILIGLSARKTALFLSLKTLKQATKYEFFELATILLLDLRNHYSFIERNLKEYERCNKLYYHYKELFEIEIKAQEMYQYIAVYYKKSKTYDEEFLNQINLYAKHAESYIIEYPYQRINLCCFLIISIKYQLKEDYISTIAVCERALAFFNVSSNRTAKYTFLFKMLTCYILLKEYNKGSQIIDTCLELQPTGSGNWFLTLEYHLILAFHTQNYQEAYITYIKAKTNSRFQYISKLSKERWYLYQSYLYFLMEMALVEDTTSEIFGRFRLNKFLNEITQLNKEKEGLNVSIICVQILILLQQRQFNKIIDRLDAIRIYQYRYLTKQGLKRSFLFLKMLLFVPKSNFNTINLDLRSKSTYKELLKIPLEVGASIESTEIIPYEELWEMLRTLLTTIKR